MNQPATAKQLQIENTLTAAFKPLFLNVRNDSHRHNRPGDESHYAVLIVSESFAGVSQVKRHQTVYAALSDIMPTVHAMGIRSYTPAEWEKTGKPAESVSPSCRKTV